MKDGMGGNTIKIELLEQNKKKEKKIARFEWASKEPCGRCLSLRSKASPVYHRGKQPIGNYYRNIQGWEKVGYSCMSQSIFLYYYFLMVILFICITTINLLLSTPVWEICYKQ